MRIDSVIRKVREREVKGCVLKVSLDVTLVWCGVVWCEASAWSME